MNPGRSRCCAALTQAGSVACVAVREPWWQWRGSLAGRGKVLVAAGAMGLQWVLLIAALVATEKLAPGGVIVSRLAGIALLVLAIVVAINPGLVVALRGTMT